MKQIQNFWNWFQDNEQEIKNAFLLHINTKEVFFHLSRNLDYVSKRIGFLIKEQEKSEKILIIFTGAGYRKLFAKLIALEEQAPDLKIFKAQAFIKPTLEQDKTKQGLDEPYIFENYELKISQLQFALIDYNIATKKLKLAIFIPHFSVLKNFEDLHENISYLLMETIGEINYRKHIKHFELEQQHKHQIGLLDLIELQEYIDYLYKISARQKPRFI